MLPTPAQAVQHEIVQPIPQQRLVNQLKHSLADDQYQISSNKSHRTSFADHASVRTATRPRRRVMWPAAIADARNLGKRKELTPSLPPITAFRHNSTVRDVHEVFQLYEQQRLKEPLRISKIKVFKKST